MKKKILIGSIIAVALLTLVSFSSVVGYNVVKNTQEEIIKDEYDGFTPIQLVFQLISKLRNHKEIENVENDVLQIIESDAELSGIIEKLESFDCDCDDKSTLDWGFPIICWELWFILMISAFLCFFWEDTCILFDYIYYLGEEFNCW